VALSIRVTLNTKPALQVLIMQGKHIETSFELWLSRRRSGIAVVARVPSVHVARKEAGRMM